MGNEVVVVIALGRRRWAMVARKYLAQSQRMADMGCEVAVAGHLG